jgi:hypothetical protein
MMEALRLRVGDAAEVQLDAKQPVDASPIALYDGPVESLLRKPFGTLERGARLYGRVWTSGPQVVVRYYQARSVAGQMLPICAVARIGGNQFRKLPESKPGMALLEFPKAVAYVVSAFRS